METKTPCNLQAGKNFLLQINPLELFYINEDENQ